MGGSLKKYIFGRTKGVLALFETVLNTSNLYPNSGDNFVLSVTSEQVIDYVEFYDNNTLLGTVSVAPFDHNINTLVGGQHFYKSIAYGILGGVDAQVLQIDTDQMLRSSQQFDDTYWSKVVPPLLQNDVTVTPNVINAPNGTLTADKLADNGNTNNDGVVFLYDDESIINISTQYAFSIYAKAGNGDVLQISARQASFGLNVWANFDLVNGVVGSIGTETQVVMEYVNDGWYRCLIVGTSTAANNIGAFVVGIVKLSDSLRQQNSSNFGYIYIWGAKLQKGNEATIYTDNETGIPYNGVPILTLTPPLVSFGYGNDLHYGTIMDYAGRYPQDGDNKLTDAVNLWNMQGLDFAFMNGDYTDNGHIAYTPETDHETALVNLDYIETVFDDFIGNRYYSLGNHDTDKMSKVEFFAHTPATSKYYSFIVNTIKFIVLDATYLSDSDTADFDTGNQDPDNHLTDYVPPTERSWLDTELSIATGKVVVLIHQSLHSDTDPLSVNNAIVVRGIIETYGNVIGVISGHEHINLKTVINNIPYISMDAMTKGAYPANAYSTIKIEPDFTINITGYGTQTSYNIPVYGPITTNADSFISIANITDTTQQNAITTLVSDLKTYGIWDKLKAIYPMVGGTAFTHKFNLKDARDLDAAYRLTFVGGLTHSATGILPNGTTGYAKTHLIPSDKYSDGNNSFGIYVRNIGIKDTLFRANIGSLGSLKSCYIQSYYQGRPISRNVGGSSAFMSLNGFSNAVGLLVSSHTNGNGSFSYNGENTITQPQYGNFLDIGYEMVLFGYNRKGDIESLTQDELSFAFIGDDLTTQQTIDIYTVIQDFQTALSRNV